MKKLLLLVITCAASASFISAAAEPAAPAPAVAPTEPATLQGMITNSPWAKAALWVGGAVLAYDVLEQVTGIGGGTINTVATLAYLKTALYNFQQSLPASVVANPKASALAFAIAVTAGTRHFLKWPTTELVMAAEASALYAVAYWLLTHQMPAPVADATTVDATAAA